MLVINKKKCQPWIIYWYHFSNKKYYSNEIEFLFFFFFGKKNKFIISWQDFIDAFLFLIFTQIVLVPLLCVIAYINPLPCMNQKWLAFAMRIEPDQPTHPCSSDHGLYFCRAIFKFISLYPRNWFWTVPKWKVDKIIKKFSRLSCWLFRLYKTGA